MEESRDIRSGLHNRKTEVVSSDRGSAVWSGRNILQGEVSMGTIRIYNKRRTKHVDIKIKEPKDAKAVMDILARNEVSFVYGFDSHDEEK